MLNAERYVPICLVFKNEKSMAPNILREFLLADPELIEVQNIVNDDMPIHCCIRSGKNPNVLEFLSILLEANNDLVNAPTCTDTLPIDLAAMSSTGKVM
jgi:hypothetical protein